MIRSLSLASFFLLFIATFANAITYDLIDLGTLGEYSTASSINDHGQAVGYSINADGNERAVLYDNGGVQDLGTLGGWSRANDINNSGQIVGTSLYGRDEHGFLYEDGAMNDLADSYAYSINDSGQIVGNRRNPDLYNLGRAFLFDDGYGSAANIKTGGFGAQAYDINDNGETVGYIDNGHGSEAFMKIGDYDIANDFTSGATSTFSLSGSTSAKAYSLNNIGQAVGASGGHAFFYDYGVGITDLHSSDWVYSSALGINDNSQAVGYFYDGTETEAFLYTGEEVLTLNDLISDDLWTLTFANDINEYGQIVGRGMYQGQGRAFLLNPVTSPVPEPSTVLLLGSGLVGLAWYGRRRKKV